MQIHSLANERPKTNYYS